MILPCVPYDIAFSVSTPPIRCRFRSRLSRMRPALTTVRQDLLEKGRAAIAALTAQLDPAHADDPPSVIVLPTELVVRESTAPPPQATQP